MTLPQEAGVVNFAVSLDVGGRREFFDAVQRHALAVVAEALVLRTADDLSARRDNDAGVAGPHGVAHDGVAGVRRPVGGARRVGKEGEQFIAMILAIRAVDIG